MLVNWQLKFDFPYFGQIKIWTKVVTVITTKKVWEGLGLRLSLTIEYFFFKQRNSHSEKSSLKIE